MKHTRRKRKPNQASAQNRELVKASSGKVTANTGPLPAEATGYLMNFFLKLHQEALVKLAADADNTKALQDAVTYGQIAGVFADRLQPYCHPRIKPISYKEHLDLQKEKQQEDAGDNLIDVTDYDKLSEAEVLRLYRKLVEET